MEADELYKLTPEEIQEPCPRSIKPGKHSFVHAIRATSGSRAIKRDVYADFVHV
jgi:hypothetical protein